MMRTIRTASLALATMLAGPALAQSASQAPPAQTRPAAGSGIQQAFEAATKLDVAGTPAARVAA